MAYVLTVSEETNVKGSFVDHILIFKWGLPHTVYTVHQSMCCSHYCFVHTWRMPFSVFHANIKYFFRTQTWNEN